MNDVMHGIALGFGAGLAITGVGMATMAGLLVAYAAFMDWFSGGER